VDAINIGGLAEQIYWRATQINVHGGSAIIRWAEEWR
jgi:hypothetical protein